MRKKYIILFLTIFLFILSLVIPINGALAQTCCTFHGDCPDGFYCTGPPSDQCNFFQSQTCSEDPNPPGPPGPTDTACGPFGGLGWENFPDSLICSGPGYCGIDTAIGCIPVGSNSGDAQTETAYFVYLLAIGLGSGIAFLLILYAGVIIITSSGDPQKLGSGKQLLTAALAGLILIIVSVTLLRIIGVDILGIPGF